MADNSAIEWCDATWNFLVGCSKVSEGCRNCYAVRSVARMAGNPTFGHRYQGLVMMTGAGLQWSGQVAVIEEMFAKPLQWTRPRKIFVNSQSDLFHEKVSEGTIARAFAVMAIAEQHTYQILTKRPERMQRILADDAFRNAVIEAMDDEYDVIPAGRWEWPLPNVWLGTSVEDQKAADERIPHLLATPAAVRFLSCEPLLGPVDLTSVNYSAYLREFMRKAAGEDGAATVGDEARLDVLNATWFDGWDSGDDGKRVDWVITGGESGPRHRDIDPSWARSLRDQCVAAGVPFFFKQHSGRTSKSSGRLLDGVEWSQFPEPAATPSTA